MDRIKDFVSGLCLPRGRQSAGGGCCLVIFLTLFLGHLTLVWAAPDAPAVTKGQELASKQDRLWLEANVFLEAGDIDQAALYFRHYWKNYPDSPRAAEALWQAALLYKQQAFKADKPDWIRVKDLFRAYVIDFSTSPRVAEAYYEVANSFFQLGFYREAQNYYTLLLKEYPGSTVEDEVLFMRGRTFLQVGKFDLASADFGRLQLSKERMIRLRGDVGQSDVHFFKGQWHDALGILKRIHHRNPDYYLLQPVILKKMGITAIRAGYHQEGRAYLLHYLNIEAQSQVDGEAFFEVAESFLQEGMLDSARLFYEKVSADDRFGRKYSILSTFRLAQYGALNLDRMSEAERLAFFTENNDTPFLEVLDTIYRDPLAQEARFAMFQRYMDRQESELAYNMGKSYLRYQTVPAQQVVIEEGLGTILVGRVSPLLAAGNYQEVRSLYEKEAAVVAAYKKAELLILIGRAYEGEGLYDQASVLYYRALALEIEEEQKVLLYFRRAEVYLANNDLKSAQRLLKYLRRLYQDQPAIAEVNWLSARLRMEQERPEDALEFYKMAVEAGGQASKRDLFAEDYLYRIFAHEDLSRVADLVAMFHRQQWLSPGRIQYWYGRLAGELARQGRQAAAVAICRQALADGLPTDGPEAQPIHLQLGDLLLARKEYGEAVRHYDLARQGRDERLAKVAETRLNEYRIRDAVADMEAMF